MNDRAISILDNYEVTLNHFHKGRGSLVCDTDQGLLVLKEFCGREERILEINPYLKQLKENDFLVETYLQNKDGGYICQDYLQNSYVLKDYFEGNECQLMEDESLQEAFRFLGHFQTELKKIGFLPSEVSMKKIEVDYGDTLAGALEEQESNELASTSKVDTSQKKNFTKYGSKIKPDIEKKNKELRHIRKFLRGKNAKTQFECFLLEKFDYFFAQAAEIEKSITGDIGQNKAIVCHGDFQYHNLLFTERGIAIINFEKMMYDDVTRDLAQFFRKVMEKRDWDKDLAGKLLDCYQKQCPLDAQEYGLFINRISYPEKFRKIANNYMNSKKMVLFNKNSEKLQKLLDQESKKWECIHFLES